MARVFVEKAIEVSGKSPYDLIQMAAKRGREISKGSKPLVESESRKSSVLALQEIEEGLYTDEHYQGNIKSAEQLAEEAKQNEESDEYANQPTESE